jgi:lysophospholipase
MRRTLRLLVPLLALAGCGKPARDAPLALAALPGPGPGAFSSEQTLLQRSSESIQPLYAAGEDGMIDGVGGVKLHYHVVRAANPRAAVVLLPGRTEPVAKYAEVMADLHAQGYSVYALDHRGQGESGRMLPNRFKGYVEHFDDYVADLETFLDQVVRKDAPRKLLLLAHSMGGGVSVLHAAKHPGSFDAIALSAPMLDISTGAFPVPVASALSFTSCSAGDGTDYAVGSGDYAKDTDFENSSVTTSRVRWQLRVDLLEANPVMQLGGVTYRFVCESMRAVNFAQQSGARNPVPTLLLQAEADTIVLPGAQARYCAEAPGCQLSVVEGSKHEILMERDALRNEALSRVVKFFDHAVAQAGQE